jgi:hypothetical protein
MRSTWHSSRSGRLGNLGIASGKNVPDARNFGIRKTDTTEEITPQQDAILMFRTTHRASLLVGALAVLAGASSTFARPAAPPPREPYSIVAQSTPATAGTGRRPISQRIAASNLPLRVPTPPDCAESVCHDDALATTCTPPESSAVAAPEGVETDAEVAADVVAVDVAAADLAPASTPAPVAAVVEDMVAEAEPPATVVDADAVAPDQPTDEVTDAVTLPPERIVTQVAAPAPTAPTSTVRESLLRRIKGALGARPQTAAPATRGPETAAVVAEPSSDAAPLPAPRPIPIAAAGSPAMVFGLPTPADEADAHAHAARDTLAADDSAGDAPARLEFDVRESRSLVGQGEQIVMRIAVRNVGSEPAERVTATLFFAEGIEPVQAIGQSAEVYPGEVRFEAVPRLSPGSSVDLLVTAVGTRPGSVTYRGELECRQMAGRIAREGAVTVRAKRVAQP